MFEHFQPVGQVHQYNNMAPVSGSYPVFSARRKTEQVDWRKIAALNIDQMAQAFDFNTLQENIYSITFCDIESEVDMRLVDPNYVKLFKLSQLTIEYLLNSQEYLTHQLGVLEETIKQYQQNVEDAKAQCDKLQKEMAKVAKESHKRKKLLMAQQQLIHGIPGNYHKCSYCPKAFLHHSYLQKHLSKRHAEASEPTNTPDVDTSSGRGSGSRSSIPAANVITTLEKQIKAMKDDLLVVQEREQQKEAEIKNLKKLFEERDNQYEADLVDLRRKLIKQSNLGSICDDEDENNELAAIISKKDAEFVPVEKKVKSKFSEPVLEKKVQSLEENFNLQFKKQEKKWQTKIENVKKKYKQEITLLQQKQKEAAVIPSAVVAKSTKRKLNYSQKPAKMNEPKNQPSKKENKTAEVTLTSQVIPIEKSECSDDDDDEDDDDDDMEVETEEEVEEESEEEEETEREKYEKERKRDEVKEITTVDQSMETTMSTTGSLTGRMQQVYQQVTQNSKIQQEMRIEMANLLSEKLEKIGLPQSTNEISEKTLYDKLSIMKKERLSKSKRYPNFEQERQHLNQLAENITKKKLEAVLTSQKVEKSQTKQGFVKMLQKQQQPKTSVKKSAVVSKFPSPTISKRKSSVNLQTPNASLSQSSLPPKPQSSLTHSSSKQWPRELWKQDSEDDDKGKSDTWSEDDEEDFVNTPRESNQIFHKTSPPARPPPIKQSFLNKSPASPEQSSVNSKSLPQLKQQPPPQQPATAARTPPVPFPRTKPNVRMVDDDDSDELQTFNGIRTVPAQTSAEYSSYKPKREPNVTRLGNIIEDKLVNRPLVHFTGAVDLLNKNETPKADDSDFSKVSSLEDDFFDNKPQIPRFSSTPASKGHTETDASSNTYSTGVWGTSSKVVSSISASGSLSSNKQLIPSESEWDDTD